MACTYQQPAIPSAYRPRIRVVLADPDPARRIIVRHTLFSTSGYELIAEAETASQLAALVTAEAPELVIGSLPLVLAADAAEHSFPLCIAIGPAPIAAPARSIAGLPEHISSSLVEDALATATVSILNVKASELSVLIHKYLLHSDAALPQPVTLEVERDGRRTEIDVDAVQWIKACGNYVRLHTEGGDCLMRASIRSIAVRLQRLGFLRIHRGTIVNSRSVRSHVVRDDAVFGVVLHDGTQLAVGPRYRDLLGNSVSAPQ